MISKMNKRGIVNIVFFPKRMLAKDKVLYIWICTTLIGGFFTFFSDSLVGKENSIPDVVETGSIYVFAITLLIPIVADIIIYFYTEASTREMMENTESDTHEENLPFYGEKSIVRDVAIILAFIVLVILISIFLFIGKYKAELILQLIFAFISFYLSFYYYCLCRLNQNREYYGKLNSYSVIEDNDIKELTEDAEKVTDKNKINVVKELSNNNDEKESTDEIDEELEEISSKLKF